MLPETDHLSQCQASSLQAIAIDGREIAHMRGNAHKQLQLSEMARLSTIALAIAVSRSSDIETLRARNYPE